MLSANDRSRWCTIRALVDNGTYIIDPIVREVHPKSGRRHWDSIDKVRHKGHDGKEHFYSSKPPLYPTMLAGSYWVIKRLAGVELNDQSFYVMRMMLIVFNVLPMLLYFVLLALLLEKYCRTDWGRLFIMAVATFGTFLTTFAVTLNNHLPAAISTLISLYAALAIWREGNRQWHYFFIAGLFAAFAAANELPALSFLAFVGGAMLLKSPVKTASGFVPGVVVVAVAFFATNYLAHGTWKVPYAHRKDGPVVVTLASSELAALENGLMPSTLRSLLQAKDIELSNRTRLLEQDEPHRWMIWDRDGQDRLAIVQTESAIEVRQWNNWYDYPGSYWRPDRKQGVDRGEPSRLVYGVHLTVGHHGIFSLTPVWVLSALGLLAFALNAEHNMRGFAALVASLTLVCLAFYLTRPLVDRNYGGVTCGLRWMFWFTPLWLLAMIPVADWFAKHSGLRWIALLLLLVSGLSASYAASNPWSAPWLYDYWDYLGWL